MNRNVIAHFSGPRAAIWISLNLFVALGGFALTFYSSDGKFISLVEKRGIFWFGMLGAAWLCGIILVAALVTQIRQLIFDNKIAVWIEGSSIVYLDKRWFLVECDEIKEVVAGTYGRFNLKGIILELKEGNHKSIPLGLLLEPSEIVLERLRNGIIKHN